MNLFPTFVPLCLGLALTSSRVHFRDQGSTLASSGKFPAVFVNVSASVNATGLAGGSLFDVYLVAEDALKNKQPTVTSIL